MRETFKQWLEAMQNYKPRLPAGFRLVHSQEEADRMVDQIRKSPPPQITLAGNTP